MARLGSLLRSGLYTCATLYTASGAAACTLKGVIHNLTQMLHAVCQKRQTGGGRGEGEEREGERGGGGGGGGGNP